jgi:hypothetical protein
MVPRAVAEEAGRKALVTHHERHGPRGRLEAKRHQRPQTEGQQRKRREPAARGARRERRAESVSAA